MPEGIHRRTRIRFSRIVLSDEFNHGLNDGRMGAWREKANAVEPETATGYIRRCSISLMVWGCVSYHGVGELFIVDGTMTSIDYIDILDQNTVYSVMNVWGCYDSIYIPI